MWPEWNETILQIAAGSSIRVIAVAAIVAVTLVLLRVRSGSVRHAAWTAVLAAMILMPVLPDVVPRLAIPAPMASRPQTPAVAAAPFTVTPVLPFESDNRAAAMPVPVASTTTTPVMPLAEPRPRPGPPNPGWPAMALGAWALGGLLLASRIGVGWRLMRRVLATGRPIEVNAMGPHESVAAGGFGRSPVGVAILESPRVATPLTVGILSPRIILPAPWRSWPDEKLQAVLAHELAHVRRHDPLVAFLAHLNRCLFWFHPLAWWLERRLATAAEDACDEAAARSLGEPRKYAEVLVEMAEAVGRAGRRFSWQGMGVDGTGLLGQRIDRALSGDLFREVSMTRKTIVAITCAAAILIVAACRQQAPPPAPLEPDPQLTEQWARQKAASEFYKAALAMTAQQAANLEAVFQKDPENQDARQRLQIFYRFSGQKTIGWNETVAARRRHILWLIEHHPADYAIDGWGTIYPAHDPTGYAQARKLWIAQTTKPDVSVAVLSNAAYFFETTDKPLAEQLLLRAQAMDPGGPRPRIKGDVYYPPWTARLGSLYARAIVGETDPMQHATSIAEAQSPFAQEARKKLADTRDPTVLMAAGGELVQDLSRPDARMDFSAAALGRSCLARAAQLDRQAINVRALLVRQGMYDRSRALYEKLKGVPREKQAEIVLALPDADRMAVEPERAESEYMSAEFFEYTKHDPAAARIAWEQTRKYAEDLLSLAARMPKDPNRGSAYFAAHVTLGALALHDNDTAAALKHMEAAGQAPASEALQYGSDMLWAPLAVGMLKRGERESVAWFLDRYARLNGTQRDQLSKAAAQIRAGKMPSFYQYATTPH
jgi:beta-lactamase regulating signal transducer with metallopeptidase domain